MKDREYTFLALIGFIIISVIYFHSRDPAENAAVFSAHAYYSPDSKKTVLNSKDLYEQITGSRKITCPTTDLRRDENAIYMKSFGGNSLNKYKMLMWIVPRDYIDVPNPDVADKCGLNYEFKLTEKAKDKSKHTYPELMEGLFAATEVCPIIAPFEFEFGNCNTDMASDDKKANSVTEDIVIYSRGSKLCRITFGNVVNWFCAGVPATTQTVKNNTDNNELSWFQHKGQHKSVIGTGANAIVTAGDAGCIIGYANADTTIKIEEYDGTEYKTISLYEFITTP